MSLVFMEFGFVDGLLSGGFATLPARQPPAGRLAFQTPHLPLLVRPRPATLI
jgi:hypothetical protein